MINKNILNSIGKKEMDRKDFLKFSGLVILSLVGVGRVVSFLTKADDNNLAIAGSHEQTTRGYGSGGYSY